MISVERMRSMVELMAVGHSQREAERIADVSHSAWANYMKKSRIRDNNFVFDGHYLHEHVEAARAKAAALPRHYARNGATNYERVAPEPEVWAPDDAEGEAHAQELIHEAAELGVKLDASDPALRNPRVHLSVNAGLRPPNSLADAERGARAVRIDGPGMGLQTPPDGPNDLRTTVSTRRYSFAERVHHGPMAVRGPDGQPLKR